MMKPQKLNKSGLMKGQSLVETALFLPILIFILVGIVEVSTVLITQNRVTTASRVASGYGAVNYDRDNWQGTAESMGLVALNTVTGTMELDPDLWDIWSIYAEVNAEGTDFEEFEAIHVAGNNNVISTAEWAVREAEVRADMLAELQAAGDSSGLRTVSSVAYHNQETFLNLPVWQWVGFQTVRGLTVMRVDDPPPFAGCPILPIAVRMVQPSVYPTDWPRDDDDMRHAMDEGEEMFFFPDQSRPQERFYVPNYINDWETPRYDNDNAIAPDLDSNTFRRNIPGRLFLNAQPGYIFKAREGTSAGGFGWLSWDGAPDRPTLSESLAYNPPPPGNFAEKYPGSDADMGYLNLPAGESSGNRNGVLEEFEWLEVATGNMNAVSEDLFMDYVYTGRPVTLVYYDIHHATGVNTSLRVRGFATVKLLGFKFSGNVNEKYIVFEFVRWANECLPDTDD
jgi:hypothetical protein